MTSVPTEIGGPNTKIPTPLLLGLSAQMLGLVIPGTVLFTMVVFRGAGQPEDVLLWAVFVAVVVCGLVTALQSVRAGRFGAGYLIPTGTSGAAIAVAIYALEAGGPPLLATLILSLAAFQLVIATRLALFRHVLTPTVTGTIIMLVPVTVMPVIFEQLGNVPDDASPIGAPASALTTLSVVVGIMLKSRGVLRQWAPIIGAVAGAVVAGMFGLYDTDRIATAPWVGFPHVTWPGIDVEFGSAFWGLLPAFMFIAAVCTIQTISGAVAIQRVSWDPPKAVDFRAVQGGVASDAAGNLVSAIAGSIPVGFRPTGIAMAEITGVASRWLGVVLGTASVLFACLPKALEVLLATPGPVIATFVAISMAMLFIVGVKVVIQDGIDYRKGFIVGIAFWIGIGFENGVVFPDLVAGMAGGLPPNGMIAGGAFAIVATLISELLKGRRIRFEASFDSSALPGIQGFVATLALRFGWNETMANRVNAVSEEVLLTLLAEDKSSVVSASKRLRITARRDADEAILEFVISPGENNLEDQLTILSETSASDTVEREVSLRLLRHLASSVRHQQYHDTDIVTVRVGPSRPTASQHRA